MEIIFEMNILLIIGLPLWIIIRGVLEAFENGSMDIVSLLVIIYCISIAYRKRYSLTGYLYVKEQLNLLSAYCTVFAIVMYIYYYLEEKKVIN